KRNRRRGIGDPMEALKGVRILDMTHVQASSCEHVGPACTWVMSRMRTPFRASIGSPIPLRLFLFCARVQAGDTTAFGAGALIDDRIDERGPARADGFLHRAAQFGRGRGVRAHAAEGLD